MLISFLKTTIPLTFDEICDELKVSFHKNIKVSNYDALYQPYFLSVLKKGVRTHFIFDSFGCSRGRDLDSY